MARVAPPDSVKASEVAEGTQALILDLARWQEAAVNQKKQSLANAQQVFGASIGASVGASIGASALLPLFS